MYEWLVLHCGTCDSIREWCKKNSVWKRIFHSNVAWRTWFEAAAIDLCSPHSICCLLAFVSSYKRQHGPTGHLPPAAPVFSTTSLLPLAAFNCRAAQIHYLKIRASFFFFFLPRRVSDIISNSQAPQKYPDFHLQQFFFLPMEKRSRAKFCLTKSFPNCIFITSIFLTVMDRPCSSAAASCNTETLRWMLATWGAAARHNRTSASLSWWGFSPVMRHNSGIKHFPR